MALQFSDTVRNAMLDAIETATGTSAVLKIYDLTAGAPANCAAAITGTILATISLGSDWAAAASGGTKAWSNLPVSDTSADGTGTGDFFRLFASDGTTCHVQGTYGTSGTDIVGDSASFTAGQTFNITAWTWTAPGA